MAQRQAQAYDVKVDVVRLRRRGIKLERAVLQVTVPLRGALRIETSSAVEQHGDIAYSTHARLLDEDSNVISMMSHINVTSMSGDHFIVSGIEIEPAAFGPSMEWPQSWWCRVVR